MAALNSYLQRARGRLCSVRIHVLTQQIHLLFPTFDVLPMEPFQAHLESLQLGRRSSCQLRDGEKELHDQGTVPCYAFHEACGGINAEVDIHAACQRQGHLDTLVGATTYGKLLRHTCFQSLVKQLLNPAGET